MSGDSKKFPDQCNTWMLDHDQAEAFFRLGVPIDARTYVHEYDTSRCMIEGELIEDGVTWDFRINGGAKAYWTQGDSVRYFGCTAPGCEELVIFMQPGMEAE